MKIIMLFVAFFGAFTSTVHASDNTAQDRNIMALERSLEDLDALRTDIDGLKAIKNDVVRLLEFERTVTTRLGDLYSKSEVDTLLKKAREDLTGACRELNIRINGRIDGMQKEIDKIKAVNKRQDAEIEGLYQSVTYLNDKVDQREVFVRGSIVGGFSLDNEDDGPRVLGMAGVGFSKKVKSEDGATTTFVDVEATFGGTSEDDGFLLGLMADVLFGDEEKGRVGPALGANVNLGNNTAEAVPGFAVELGSPGFSFLLRALVPINVAGPPGSKVGIDEYRTDLGFVGRW
jgi:hypothetical protein